MCMRDVLKADSGPAGEQAVWGLVLKVLKDEAVIAEYLTAGQCRPRKALYENPELGFWACGHVYEAAAIGAPNDHDSNWAIYGLAVGDAETVDWRVVTPGDGDRPTLVAPEPSCILSGTTQRAPSRGG